MKTFDLIFWKPGPFGPDPVKITGQQFRSRTAAVKAGKAHAKSQDWRFLQANEIEPTEVA